MEKDIEFIKELIKRLCEEYKIKKFKTNVSINLVKSNISKEETISVENVTIELEK